MIYYIRLGKKLKGGGGYNIQLDLKIYTPGLQFSLLLH